MSTTQASVSTRWRTVDIVITAIIAVTFGVVFWAWNLLWAAAGPAFLAFPPAQAFMYGVWLMPAVIAPMIIRKPGAALFAELLAAIVSALLGSAFGGIIIFYGLLQGLGGELGFAAFGYRRFGWPQALLAAAFAGAAAVVLDITYYYPTWSPTWMGSYAALVIASSMVLAGVGALALTRGLARAGVLGSFAAGRVAH